uniref:Uncharacterized protein n=1 Tax=Gallus gallus TaxID=9031 RepID=A0A8V1AD89_CHICK
MKEKDLSTAPFAVQDVPALHCPGAGYAPNSGCSSSARSTVLPTRTAVQLLQLWGRGVWLHQPQPPRLCVIPPCSALCNLRSSLQMCVHTSACVCMHACACAHMQTHAHTCSHVHTHAHTCSHVQTHTHTLLPPSRSPSRSTLLHAEARRPQEVAIVTLPWRLIKLNMRAGTP